MIKYDNQMIKYYNSTCNFEEINERSPDIQILQTNFVKCITKNGIIKWSFFASNLRSNSFIILCIV